MKATVSVSFWISLLLLSFCCRPAEGENRLIGSDNPIIVAPGQDVILPCRLELEMDLLHKTIEWSKEGSKTEPARRRSWKTYVFLYRRGIQISAMMMQLYIQRTSLFDERLRHGDVSLKIMNVTLDDSGTYDCFLPERGQRAKVQLVVSPDIPTSTTKMQLYFNSPTSFYRWDGDSQRNGQTSVFVCVFLGFSLVLLLCFIIRRYLNNWAPSKPK
ncbi:selection and upkeep of intraepithelial T-cells protein 4 isoform X2 [Oryzias latipes]